MEEMSRHGRKGRAAMRSGMNRNTAAQYVKAGKLPSEMVTARTWRTRSDPFEKDWPGIVAMLREAPTLEAKTIFDDLVGRKPDGYEEGQLRTLQRRIQVWRASEGPEKEVFFAQEHRPGEAMQTDFTWATDLGITIAGESFSHMLCHAVLPYSNWTWATGWPSLPPGLSLSSSGIISGTPTRAGTYGFTVSVTGGDARTISRSLSITIKP